MHTWKSKNGGTTILYNSDFSGDARIATTKEGKPQLLEVPAEDLLEFVAEYVRGQKIAALEGADWREILGLEDRARGRVQKYYEPKTFVFVEESEESRD